MRLAVLTSPRRFDIVDVPPPRPGRGEVLVDVAASPDRVSPEDLAAVQQRIDSKGLLLKMRVLSSEVQKRQLIKRKALTS